jgi:Holliday junction resolvase RusA-like endonuclease
MIITFSVPGTPQPCQYRQTTKGVIYQNARTKTWQRVVGMAAMAAVREQCPSFKLGMYSGAVQASGIFRIQPAKSAEHISGSVHCQKPDVTNLWKGLEDGLKHILWCDDCQVQSVMIQKMWSNGNPGAEIRIDLFEYEL